MQSSIILILTLALLTGCAAHHTPDTPHGYALPFGVTRDGEPVTVFTLKNPKLTAKIIDYGATLIELDVPDRNGKPGDIVLGYDQFAPYETNPRNFGVTVGRYANRIAGGRFTLDGKTYELPKNDNGNTKHGGPIGFAHRRWDGQAIATPDGPAVKLTLVSRDDDQGFPGTLTTTVVYTLLASGLRIDYTAVTDKPTVVNLTNHSYFNLTANPAANTVFGHVVTVDADRYLPSDAKDIPTGEIASVAGTPFDFRTPHPIGERIAVTGGHPAGYNHNYVLTGGQTQSPRPVATAFDPATGRTLEVRTTEPGLQLYTANALDGKIQGKHAVPYGPRTAVCFETQHYPDSPNRPAFPSTVLRPGETFRSTTEFLFGAK